MITSIEPGLYRPGQWGIRIENLVMNVPAAALEGSEFGEFLEFETLTLCPIDTRCIERALLRADEIEWLDAYHATVRSRLAPLLSGAALDWLLVRTDADLTSRRARAAAAARAAAVRRRSDAVHASVGALHRNALFGSGTRCLEFVPSRRKPTRNEPTGAHHDQPPHRLRRRLRRAVRRDDHVRIEHRRCRSGSTPRAEAAALPVLQFARVEVTGRRDAKAR